MPNRVDNMIILFCLKEGVAHESDHYENGTERKVQGEIVLGRKPFLRFATSEAPAKGDDTDTSKRWCQKYPKRLFIELRTECQENRPEHVQKRDKCLPNVGHSDESHPYR